AHSDWVLRGTTTGTRYGLSPVVPVLNSLRHSGSRQGSEYPVRWRPVRGASPTPWQPPRGPVGPTPYFSYAYSRILLRNGDPLAVPVFFPDVFVLFGVSVELRKHIGAKGDNFQVFLPGIGCHG